MWTMNPDVKLVLKKAEEPEIKLPMFVGSWKKQGDSRKKIYFCFIEYTKPTDCVDHSKLCKILKEMWISDHLTCLLYADQKATVRTRHGKVNWLQIGKGCILSPCLFNFCAEYIMWIAGLEDSEVGIKTAGRNMSLWYADDNTLRAESKEELRASWWEWKRRVKKLA